jgi:hypothetical protein
VTPMWPLAPPRHGSCRRVEYPAARVLLELRRHCVTPRCELVAARLLEASCDVKTDVTIVRGSWRHVRLLYFVAVPQQVTRRQDRARAQARVPPTR